MSSTKSVPSDVAFTDSVKKAQARLGSRQAYARMEQGEGWETVISPELASFISERDSFFFATSNAEGQPYIQHRGGPKGFLRVLDERTLAFADFRGNRQYISVGNLAENAKVHLFLVDYLHRQRIKIWGEARVIEDVADPLVLRISSNLAPRVERAIVIRVVAWDANCPQHIPELIGVEEVKGALEAQAKRIAELEEALRSLRSRPAVHPEKVGRSR